MIWMLAPDLETLTRLELPVVFDCCECVALPLRSMIGSSAAPTMREFASACTMRAIAAATESDLGNASGVERRAVPTRWRSTRAMLYEAVRPPVVLGSVRQAGDGEGHESDSSLPSLRSVSTGSDGSEDGYIDESDESEAEYVHA